MVRVRAIRQGLRSVETTLALIQAAYDEHDWQVLGHRSWEEYLATEFGEVPLQIPKARREEIVSQLADTMSTRAIAVVLGVSKDTVHRALPVSEDRPTVSNETVA